MKIKKRRDSIIKKTLDSKFLDFLRILEIKYPVRFFIALSIINIL